jgi:hypothetical protein
MDIAPKRSLVLHLNSRRLGPWLPLLTAGLEVELRTGCSLRRLLTAQLGFNPSYVEGRIQTLFLNGMPVDDLDATMVPQGAVIALSGAMPGLAGATLRRGGALSGMRRGISHGTAAAAWDGETGRVTLKLFNVVADEMGRKVLSAGFLAPAARLKKPAAETAAGDAVAHAAVDGKAVAPEDLARLLSEEGTWRVEIHFPEPETGREGKGGTF